MTDRAPKLLFDALTAIASAQEFVVGCTLAQYIDDKMRRSAVERQLEILGEACSRLARMDSDDEIVFLTVTQDLDSLRAQLTQLLAARG